MNTRTILWILLASVVMLVHIENLPALAAEFAAVSVRKGRIRQAAEDGDRLSGYLDAEAFAHHGVVVGEDDTHGALLSCCWGIP